MNEKVFIAECEELFTNKKYDELRKKLESLDTLSNEDRVKVTEEIWHTKNNDMFNFIESYFYTREQC